jgi:hypothetical protein
MNAWSTLSKPRLCLVRYNRIPELGIGYFTLPITCFYLRSRPIHYRVIWYFYAHFLQVLHLAETINKIPQIGLSIYLYGFSTNCMFEIELCFIKERSERILYNLSLQERFQGYRYLDLVNNSIWYTYTISPFSLIGKRGIYW